MGTESKLYERLGEQHARIAALESQVAALTKERDEAEAALDKLFHDCTDGGCMDDPEGILPTSHGYRHERVRDICRKALTRTKEPTT